MNSDQNHEIFEQRFRLIQTALRGYLFAATRDWTATDELFQEVATVLWRKFGEFDAARDFRAWVLGVARLQVLKRRQSLARSRLIFSDDVLASLASTAGSQTENEDWRLPHLAACVEKLPPGDRRLLAMRYEQNLSLVEIGRRLAKSVAATGMSTMRVRRWLRDCIEKTMAIEQAGTP